MPVAPHRPDDPVPVACEIVGALQTMVTRRIDVFDPAVVTIAKIWAGTTNNVIPDTAHVEGTIRTFSETTRDVRCMTASAASPRASLPPTR